MVPRESLVVFIDLLYPFRGELCTHIGMLVYSALRGNNKRFTGDVLAAHLDEVPHRLVEGPREAAALSAVRCRVTNELEGFGGLHILIIPLSCVTLHKNYMRPHLQFPCGASERHEDSNDATADGEDRAAGGQHAEGFDSVFGEVEFVHDLTIQF